MQEIIKNFLISISHHQILVYCILFFISFFESFVIVGLIVPGAVFIVTAGLLSSHNILNFYQVIIWSIFGAILSDIISFYLAKKYGKRIIKSKYYKRYQEYFEKGEIFFKKYGGISVFWGRFIGFLRPIVPFLAGLLKMDKLKFYFYAIVSGILWGICYPGLGYVFGESYKIIEKYIGRLNLVIIIFIVIIFLFKKLTSLSRKK